MAQETDPHWWLKPMTKDSLRTLRATVQLAHERGLGLACVTMNQIKVALAELQERMDRDDISVRSDETR